MAKANPSKLDPKPPVLPEGGPVIEYVGEGADKIVFFVNPAATKYVVYADGHILETF